MIIAGVDPGLNATGYGIIDAGRGRLAVLAAGAITPPRRRPLAERLGIIHDRLSVLVLQHQAAVLVLERIFTHHTYVNTAALMAHARGVACLIAQQHGIALAEYSPTQVKQSLTGRGSATKDQVARMVGQWLQTSDPAWSSDATDALALAIMHAHHTRQDARLPVRAG